MPSGPPAELLNREQRRLEQRRQGLATIKETCEFLRVNHVTVYAMIRDGQLAATKIRNARRVPWDALYAIADAAMGAE